MIEDNIIFVITKEGLQDEAKKRIGKELTKEEIDIAIKGINYGLETIAIDVIYNTIFTEMIK